MMKITNLKAGIEDKRILKGVNLEVNEGEITVLMGPNGSGKSTLSKAIAGHPDVEIYSGSIKLDDLDLTSLEANERSLAGAFCAFQYPIEIPGVNFADFLRIAVNARLPKEKQLPVFKFRKLLKQKAEELGIDPGLIDRGLNEGLSGGERKKMEVLQLAMLEPKYAILDETDSGLDVDALKSVFTAVQRLAKKLNLGLLIITHYQRIFEYVQPDRVLVMNQGAISHTGGAEVLELIAKNGYQQFV